MSKNPLVRALVTTETVRNANRKLMELGRGDLPSPAVSLQVLQKLRSVSVERAARIAMMAARQ